MKQSFKRHVATLAAAIGVVAVTTWSPAAAHGTTRVYNSCTATINVNQSTANPAYAIGSAYAPASGTCQGTMFRLFYRDSSGVTRVTPWVTDTDPTWQYNAVAQGAQPGTALRGEYRIRASGVWSPIYSFTH